MFENRPRTHPINPLNSAPRAVFQRSAPPKNCRSFSRATVFGGSNATLFPSCPGRARERSARSKERLVDDIESRATVGVESGLRLSGRKRCSWASENPRFRGACQVFLTGYGNAVLR